MSIYEARPDRQLRSDNTQVVEATCASRVSSSAKGYDDEATSGSESFHCDDEA